MLEGNLKKWNVTSDPVTQNFGTVLKELTFPRQDFKGLDRKTLNIYNSSLGTLLHAIVESSPDGAKWGTVDGTSFVGLGSANIARATYESTDRYWRFRARSNQNGTTIDGTVYAPGTSINGTTYGGTVAVSILKGWWIF